MPSPSNASYLLIARFVFVFLNIISISEVLNFIMKLRSQYIKGMGDEVKFLDINMRRIF